MVASVLRALEFVLVDKSSSESRAQAGKDMTPKLNEKCPAVLVFAEGHVRRETGVGVQGRRVPIGHTVQPVAVRYRRSSYDPTNDPTNMVWHFIRATFDLHHGMDVEFLDVTSKQVDETPSDLRVGSVVVLPSACKYLCPIIPTTIKDYKDGVGNFINGRLPI